MMTAADLFIKYVFVYSAAWDLSFSLRIFAHIGPYAELSPAYLLGLNVQALRRPSALLLQVSLGSLTHLLSCSFLTMSSVS